MKEGSKHTSKTKKKISESLKDNLNAEKWTKEIVIDILEQMLECATTPINKDTGEMIHLKKELLFKFKIWNMNWFNHMAEKFANDETVMGLLHACACVCEINSYKAAANGLANPMIVKANLAHHYNWQDKSSVVTKDATVKTDEELDKEIAEYEKINKS